MSSTLVHADLTAGKMSTVTHINVKNLKATL